MRGLGGHSGIFACPDMGWGGAVCHGNERGRAKEEQAMKGDWGALLLWAAIAETATRIGEEGRRMESSYL